MGFAKCGAALLLLAVCTVSSADIYDTALYDAGSKAYYKIHKTPSTWFSAYTTCAKEGGHLAMVNNENIDFLRRTFPSADPGQRILLGFDNWVTGKWATIQDNLLSDEGYQSWAAGEPNNFGGNQRCGAMYGDGNLDDDDCHHKNPYVCQIDAFPGEYTYYEGTKSYYKFHVKPRTWLDAHATCTIEGGHLAIINNNDEANFFKKNYPSNTDSVFLGFSNWENKDSWVTVHGQPLSYTGYEEWSPGEPNNGGGRQQCGTMYRSGKFDDDYCDRKLPFICEKKSNKGEDSGITTTQPTTTRLSTTGSERDLTTAATEVIDISTSTTSQTIEEFESDKLSRIHIEHGKVVKYTIHKNPRTWLDAFATCIKVGGHLAIPNEYNGRFFVSNYPYDTMRVFLGFNDFGTGSWRTIRGESLSDTGYEFWNDGEPNNAGGNQRCGTMYKNALFEDEDCLRKHPFFCKIDDSYPNYRDTQSTEGYIYHEATRMYYRFHKQPASWLTAYATCIQEGGNLAVINSQDEANFFIKNYPTNADSVLLGFNNWEANDTWITVDGQTLSKAGYEEWAAGRHSRAGATQRCGTMYRSGKLDGDVCDRELPFICERKSKSHPSDDARDIELDISFKTDDTTKVTEIQCATVPAGTQRVEQGQPIQFHITTRSGIKDFWCKNARGLIIFTPSLIIYKDSGHIQEWRTIASFNEYSMSDMNGAWICNFKIYKPHDKIVNLAILDGFVESTCNLEFQISGITRAPTWYGETSYTNPENIATSSTKPASITTLYTEPESHVTSHTVPGSIATSFTETHTSATSYRSDTKSTTEHIQTVTNQIDVNGTRCVDSYQQCDLIRRNKLCGHKYYLKVCCATCTVKQRV